MLITFIGIQVLLAIAICSFALLVSVNFKADLNQLLGLILVDTVVSVITMTTLYLLLTPIIDTAKLLHRYLDKDEDPSELSSVLSHNVPTLLTNTDEAIERLNAEIEQLTNYDTLTGLPNRSLFKSSLQQKLDKSDPEQQLAIVVIDLDNLKDVNSILGREVGNLLLTEIAQRLAIRMAREDILARFGGSDFAVLRENICDREQARDLSRYLLDSFAEPFTIGERTISCSAKIGIAIYPVDGCTAEQLLRNVDTAIFQANQQSLDAYQFYSPIMSGKLQRTLAIRENLRYALVRNELYLRYQPRIEMATGKVAGVEALLRWHSPELGIVSPIEFIPIAEANNTIIQIGEWVLQQACRQNKQWQESGLEPVKISVNLSTRQFKQANLIETVERILKNTGLDCRYLELEVTESLLVDDFDKAVSLLHCLKQKGISIALDDFGTGYSSLRYLQKLPIDTLKIDRSFMVNIDSSSDNAAISKAIVALAQSLQLNITAEGVETEAQLLFLQSQGCQEAQGYYFSKPIAPEMLVDFLRDRQVGTKFDFDLDRLSRNQNN